MSARLFPYNSRRLCYSMCWYEALSNNSVHEIISRGTGGSVNILRQLLFVSLTQEAASDAASERRVLRLTPRPNAASCG
ncbi:hypothetical protein YC2023_105949 [Brassica napus]